MIKMGSLVKKSAVLALALAIVSFCATDGYAGKRGRRVRVYQGYGGVYNNGYANGYGYNTNTYGGYGYGNRYSGQNLVGGILGLAGVGYGGYGNGPYGGYGYANNGYANNGYYNNGYGYANNGYYNNGYGNSGLTQTRYYAPGGGAYMTTQPYQAGNGVVNPMYYGSNARRYYYYPAGR